MKDDPLHKAAVRYHKAAREADDRRQEMYRLIRKAKESGRSLREIGKAVGLSHGRIQQVTE